jgi:FlaA1/EpsC-like NDP-sugar epimerase
VPPNKPADRHFRLRNRYLFAIDAISLILATLFAFAARFEEVPWVGRSAPLVGQYLVFCVPVRLAVFYFFGLYRRLWKHASIGELKRLVAAGMANGAIGAVIGLILLPSTGLTPSRVPFSIVFMDAMLAGAFVALPRVLARTGAWGHPQRRRDDRARRTLVVGAGTTAKQVVKELFANARLGMLPIGFVDDDLTKHGHMLYDLPVLGSVSDIPQLIGKHDVAEIVIAMPSASGAVIRKVVRAALDSGISTLTVPSLPEIISQKGGGASLREVEIQDLLRRDPVETDLASVAALATGETVLITGAGGSIGSELCRQLGRLAPTRLVVLGHGENSIFDIYHELRDSFPDVKIVPVIADVRDRDRMMSLMATYRPHAVFHAAAHKHVPLMEDNVVEAITNNVSGTRNTVDAAIAADVGHFVLISTDKAVRPTSVMGASKRVAEQIVQLAAARHDRNFVSVRFGNVLGSRGSVVPMFMRQIRAGGPVTVTHPEMQRFFMTIPEAVQLVLQAGALGRGGEVFVLDMGEPVKVVDLATDLIRLSGLEPGHDIKIQFVGIRPGEKLYEEMFFTAEHVLPTDHPKVLRARNGLLADGTMRKIDALAQGGLKGEVEEQLRKLLRELVPDFQPHAPPSPRSTATPHREFTASIA